MANDKIRLGISTCLLGEKVRYDGGHKLDPFIRDTLGQWVEFVPVCPEVECGLPVPREAMRLVGEPGSPRLMTIKSGIDHTGRMLAWAEERLEGLAREDLCGFIFKSKSPSSGLERIKVYPATPGGMPVKNGVGIFARLFMQRFPYLPVEDEGRLHDPVLRENFIERIFVMQRWRALLAENASPGALVEFHTRHKLLLMAHSVEGYRSLGRLVAGAGQMASEGLFSEYPEQLMRALRLAATPKKNVNVLTHILGYFKKVLAPDEKQELLELIGAYGAGHVPLLVPLTLIKHYVRKYGQPYLEKQYYLNPHPLELKLRTHV
ncbi:DUF523 and DUF1722 domain-containing protein [bacterium]|nr:DUF523 and DUF1722 domain-containing protein [bacterium]